MSELTHKEIAAECERLFQAGGPKVYTFRVEKFYQSIRGSQRSGRSALEYAFKGEVVYARRKYRNEYRWINLGAGS